MSGTCSFLLFLVLPVSTAPVVGPLVPVTGEVPRYGKFEATFALTTRATNPYWPYDPASPPGVVPGAGVTVDALLLPPGESNWNAAKVQPCFYYQPVEEAGTGTAATFLPRGEPEWRVRFGPDQVGTWRVKIRVRDAGGTAESPEANFFCTASGNRGPVRVAQTDPRWFEFADGTPFVTPLVNLEEGNPLNGLSLLRSNLLLYGTHGVRFVRWFPTDEGANFAIYPFGGEMLPSWGFGREGGADTSTDADTAQGKKFSFVPYAYSGQSVPGVPGALYELRARAKVTGDSVLQLKLQAGTAANEVFVPANGGWQDYVVRCTSTSGTTQVTVQVREAVGGGSLRVHSLVLRRDLTGAGTWSPNLLAHPDPDSYAMVDARHAALLDEVFHLSEQYGIYHKLTLLHKNDRVLGRFLPDGTVASSPSLTRMYSGEGQAGRWYQKAWYRYFIARWSYSVALHSVEYANENDPNSAAAFDAGYAVADTFNALCPRRVLVSNSFWHSFPTGYWSDARMDYADIHAYLNNAGDPPSSPFHSHSLNDSALSTRQCRDVFRSYGLNKPVLRGETGVFDGHWAFGWYPPLALDTGAVYDHKKLWAHVGTGGYLCDGQWHTVNLRNGNWGMYGAYERFMAGEAVNNGRYTVVGTDQAGTAMISSSATDLRATGVADKPAGRALLWIENAQHTWRNVADRVAVPSVSGVLVVPGFPAGRYELRWWETIAGAVRGVSPAVVLSDTLLSFTVVELRTDVALKVVAVEIATPTPVPTATSTPTVWRPLIDLR